MGYLEFCWIVAQACGELEEFQHRVTEAAVGAAVLVVLGALLDQRGQSCEDIAGCCHSLCPVNYSVNSCIPARTHMHTHTHCCLLLSGY